MSKSAPLSGSMRDAAKAALAEREVEAPMGEFVDPETGEVTPGTVATSVSNTQVAAADESDDDFFYNPAYAEFDVVKQVTIPVLKWQAGQTVIVQLTQPFKLGKDISAITKMQPPHLTVARNPKGGLRTLILGAVLKEELESQYPDQSYVGRWFTMRKLPREKFINQLGEMTEKRYSLYQVIEITDPGTTLRIRREA